MKGLRALNSPTSLKMLEKRHEPARGPPRGRSKIIFPRLIPGSKYNILLITVRWGAHGPSLPHIPQPLLGASGGLGWGLAAALARRDTAYG